MNETDIDDRPDVNSGKEWSEMDVFDLANNIRLKNLIEEIARFPVPIAVRGAREDRRARAIGRVR